MDYESIPEQKPKQLFLMNWSFYLNITGVHYELSTGGGNPD